MTNPEELRGWDEIAGHLRVSPRTAQTYERERGLPVRRMPGPKGRVWALAADLNQWRADHHENGGQVDHDSHATPPPEPTTESPKTDSSGKLRTKPLVL